MRALLRCVVYDHQPGDSYNVQLKDEIDNRTLLYTVPEGCVKVYGDEEDQEAWLDVLILVKDSYSAVVIIPSRSTANHIGRVILTASMADITYSFDVED